MSSMNLDVRIGLNKNNAITINFAEFLFTTS